MKTEFINLPLNAISITGGTQSRVALNQEAVAEYAEVIRHAGELPPVVVFNDGASDGLWLADGFHRYHAHRAAGALEITCDVRVGTQRDAVLCSAGANASHGLRRTSDDKRHAVMLLLNDSEWSAWSQEKIAKTCGVSTGLVSKIVNELSLHCEEMRPAVRVVERSGQTYEQKTSNIGRGKSAPTPVAAKGEAADGETSCPPDPAQDDCGPSEAEIAVAVASEAVQLDYIQNLLANENDPLTKALADVAQMRLLNGALKSQNDGYQATIAEQIRMIKALRAKLVKLERTQ